MATSHKYKKRRMWEKEDMAAAIIAVREKKIDYLSASKQFNVPRSTLCRYVNDKDSSIESLTNKVIGRRPVFNQDIENQLAEYILTMKTKFYGLTRLDMRRLAYQLALKNNIKNPFKDGFAGRYWLMGFLKRHQNILSKGKRTGTSQTRVNGFTKERMDEFYDNLEKTQIEKSFPAARIFNVDESGLSIVKNKIPEIIVRKGKTHIGEMTSAEKGSLITIVTCMSPAGIFVPPMIIFPRKKISDALMKGAPDGSVGKAHPSGWIQTHLFTEWFEHFIDYVKPTEASPVLLILDGHYSHMKNIHLIDLAKKHYVTILSIPPHCTHKVQPVNRTFMGPLTSYYSEEVRVFLREFNRPLTLNNIVGLFGKAYSKCQTAEIAADGFRLTGIYPFNRNVFTQSDYMAAAADFEESKNSQTDPEPGPSGSSTEIVSAYNMSPVPTVKKRTSNRDHKPVKSSMTSSSTYKKDLNIAQVMKSDKVNRETEKNIKEKIKNITKKRKRGNMAKRDTIDPNPGTVSRNDTDSSDAVAVGDETAVPTDKDAECFFCFEKYIEDKSAEWVQCLMCELWVHSSCGGYKSGVYICDFCKNNN